MAYAMLSTYGKDNRSLSAAAGILRGYNAVYRLTPLERKHLVLLVACRLACSCTLGAYSIQQNPANKYLLLHAEPAWKALEMIWCYDPDQLAIAADRLFNRFYIDHHYEPKGALTVDCSGSSFLDSRRVRVIYCISYRKDTTSRFQCHSSLPQP
jgi:hypothetical protein